MYAIQSKHPVTGVGVCLYDACICCSCHQHFQHIKCQHPCIIFKRVSAKWEIKWSVGIAPYTTETSPVHKFQKEAEFLPACVELQGHPWHPHPAMPPSPRYPQDQICGFRDPQGLMLLPWGLLLSWPQLGPLPPLPRQLTKQARRWHSCADCTAASSSFSMIVQLQAWLVTNT